MPEIPVPKPNNGPAEAPLIRTTEPRTIIRSDQPSKPEIRGRVYTKEPTFKEKLRRSFLKEDIRSVRDYVLFDVLIPNFKKSVFETVMGALGQTLGIQLPKSYPSGIFSNNSSNRTASGYRDYTAISSRGRDPIQERNSMDYDRYRIRDIIFDSKEEALSLLELMTDICDANGAVSVFTFFEKASHGDPRIKNGNHYTNHKWGWRNLNGVYVTEVPCPEFESGIGYLIDLPDARPI